VNAADFNARYPVGTPVVAYPGCRPEDDANDERLVTRTRSKAEVLGGHKDVVWVDGHDACIALTHVDVVTEEQWAEACAGRDADTTSQRPPKHGSREWLEQLPRDERWAHTEVLAIWGDTVVNPSYKVALYHLRYAVAEVKRLTDQVAELEADSRLLASLQACGVDNWDGYDDAIQAVAS
jgi:hypothetical protein